MKVQDHIWLLNENNEATGYLVVGEKQAAVIDTMNGYQDLRKTVRAITELPVIVINTHGHTDHVWGDGYFGEAYLNQADWVIAEQGYKKILYQYIKLRNQLKDVRFTDIREGDCFDLGGVTLTAYSLPGHTPGGMCFLDREDRILFTGDGINRHCWMQLAEALPIATFVENLEALGAIRKDYDYICHGHAAGLEEATLYDELLTAAKELCNGQTSMDTTYEYWGGTCMQHPFPSGNGVIVYR
ncbi:MAG: MBL fold metallo-hydrolase [Eubacteriales bacterium]|nr:MBL fold metallo-hydrolase [Eubacteriales bacterium]